MASLEDLKSALKITLENKGVLQQVKAQIRAEIFNSLDEQETEKPQLSSENILINELIREYLEYNHHFHTVAVLLPESGQPEGSLGRTVLAKELRIADEGHTRDLPLLYTLVGRAKQLNPPITQNPIAHVAEPKWAGGTTAEYQLDRPAFAYGESGGLRTSAPTARPVHSTASQLEPLIFHQ